jgi:hypothetical protein
MRNEQVYNVPIAWNLLISSIVDQPLGCFGHL